MGGHSVANRGDGKIPRPWGLSGPNQVSQRFGRRGRGRVSRVGPVPTTWKFSCPGSFTVVEVTSVEEDGWESPGEPRLKRNL